MPSQRVIYGVRRVEPEEICSTSLLTDSLERAEQYATSTDPNTLAGAVTEYHLNALGVRHAVSLYVGGVRQRLPHASNDGTIRPSHWSPEQKRQRRAGGK